MLNLPDIKENFAHCYVGPEKVNDGDRVLVAMIDRQNTTGRDVEIWYTAGPRAQFDIIAVSNQKFDLPDLSIQVVGLKFKCINKMIHSITDNCQYLTSTATLYQCITKR